MEFGGSGKERRGGCFLVEMKGPNSGKTSLRGSFLVMLSDTWNNNLSLRGRIRSFCGFAWTSLKDEVAAIKHHRITQASN